MPPPPPRGEALSRALDTLLTTGQPFGEFHGCYLDLPPLAEGVAWFGIFMHSAGDRLIFFPGLANLHQHVQTAKEWPTWTNWDTWVATDAVAFIAA
jgi:hypothetical protein